MDEMNLTLVNFFTFPKIFISPDRCETLLIDGMVVVDIFTDSFTIAAYTLYVEGGNFSESGSLIEAYPVLGRSVARTTVSSNSSVWSL